MKDIFSGLAALHTLATRYGDGLKPELLDLAQRSEHMVHQGVVPLEVKAVSSGPSHQTASQTSLNASNISSLEAARLERSLRQTG